MGKYKHCYLLSCQYLGLRFHGWAKQKDQKTVEGMIDKTIQFVLGNDNFKILGSSRTDSKVSALETHFELFAPFAINELDFRQTLNENLPQDIRISRIRSVDNDFNIIQNPKLKSYAYLFCFGEKPHPFSAPFLAHFKGELNIDQMALGAQLFEGRHDFRHYSSNSNQQTRTKRDIVSCKLEANDIIKASFLPEQVYALKISSNGFLRYQVRLIMAQLVELGKGNVTIDYIKQSLIEPPTLPLRTIAPGSGLILLKSDLDL